MEEKLGAGRKTYARTAFGEKKFMKKDQKQEKSCVVFKFRNKP